MRSRDAAVRPAEDEARRRAELQLATLREALERRKR